MAEASLKKSTPSPPPPPSTPTITITKARSPSPSRPSAPTTTTTTPNNNKIHEGVFALNKPLHITSAQAIRDLQSAFDRSRLFAPWLAAEKARRAAVSPGERRRGRRARLQVKMGHGGTLDPLATGVLVVGVGSGTKRLPAFLNGCSKEYRATLLFGAATDSYDRGGKVVARAPYGHVTRERVEAAIVGGGGGDDGFRGDVMQTPPIYSALKMNGKPLYEYARKGKELPRSIEMRATRVERLEITRWLEGGTHGHKWPAEQAPVEERKFVSQVLQLDEVAEKEVNDDGQGETAPSAADGLKRKHEEGSLGESAADEEPATKKIREDAGDAADAAAGLEVSTLAEATGEQAPAVELDMTVASGFYVRSLCHDLGKAVGSLGMMATLERTRQGEFALASGNVLEYEDLSKGEEVWGPKVQALLEASEKMEQKDKN